MRTGVEASTAEPTLRFRDFELSAGGDALWRAGAAVAIRPKPLALLAHLLRNRARVISTSELLAVLWPDVSVSHHALWSAVRDLRRAIGDTDTAERTVRTVRGRGFVFVAEVAGLSTPELAPEPAPIAVALAPAVPQRVREVLRWQLERTSPDCQRVLRLLSVVGRELELAVLVHAAEASHGVVLELLAEAEVAGFALVGGEHATGFGFAHGLVRESIYRDLPLAERARLHRRLADAFAAVLRAGAACELLHAS